VNPKSVLRSRYKVKRTGNGTAPTEHGPKAELGTVLKRT
jgi:hypothetical protein